MIRAAHRERVAAIDCGTNTIRLLVADRPDPAGPGADAQLTDADAELTDADTQLTDADTQLTDVVRRMEIVRLGAGVDRTSRLAADAIERTRVVLAEYTAQIRALGAERVRMVATSASRDAANADEFRTMVHATLGRDPEVVSGDEEARLSFEGAVRGLPVGNPPPYLVIDIGGGSTEFVTGTRTVDHAVSVDIGAVRMTERYLHSDPATEGEIAAAQRDITQAAKRALDAVDGRSASTIVGVAGSVTTVAAIALGLEAYEPDRIHHARIAAADVRRVAGELLAMTQRERLAIPVMHPGRADVIGAGALILRTVLEEIGAAAVVASNHDILDGIAWSIR